MAILIIVASLFLDTGTQGFAEAFVQRPTFLHEGRVLQWGFAERSIPVPAGLPRVGDCSIRLADTDRKWRDLLSHQTPRRRLIQLDILNEDVSPQTSSNIGVFEVVDCIFPQDQIEITGRDITFAWLDKPIIPNLITRRNFPELPQGIDEAFTPIIGGQNRSNPENPQGVIPLPHMGLFVSPISPLESPAIMVDRWCVAAHPVFQVVTVYRKLVGDGEFTVVPTNEYMITEADPLIIDGIEYNMTFLDFHVEQDAGTEIRIDCDGFDFRGDWGVLSAITSLTGPLRNPVDFLINILYVILADELQIPRINTQSFETVRTIMAGEHESPVGFIYLCDGAIVESITARAFLSQFLTCFEIDFYQNRNGEIEINVTIAEDPDRPIFDDTFHFLKGSVTSRLPNPTFNRWRSLFDLNLATKEYAKEAVQDNSADQTALALPTSPPLPYIEEEIVEMPFVRDADTVEQVILRRRQFLALGSYRVDVRMPMAEVFEDLELAQLVGVTHYGGLEYGGWENAEFKVTDLVHDLGARVTIVKAVLREPQTITQESDVPLPIQASACGRLEGEWTHDSRVGPFQGVVAGQVFGVFRNPADSTQLQCHGSLDFGETWAIMDDTFPSLANTIVSHDGQHDAVNGVIHVATQESNGRVAYHVFNLTSRTWTQLNEQWVASANIAIGVVQICRRAKTPAQTAIAYETNLENISSTDYSRIGLKYKPDSGAISAEFHIGDWGLEQNNVLSRIVPSSDGALQLFFNKIPGDFVFSTADLVFQTMRSSDAIDAAEVFLFTGLLSTTAECFAGDYAVWEDQGTKMGIPFKRGGEAYMVLFNADETAVDNMVMIFVPDCIPGCPLIFESPFINIASQMCARITSGDMHVIGFKQSIADDTWLFHKVGDPILGLMPAESYDNQLGPIFPAGPLISQEMGANVVTQDAQNYVQTFTASGVGVLFNRIATNQLPSSPDFDVNDFLNNCIHATQAAAVSSTANTHNVTFDAIVLGTETTLIGWYYLTGVATNNFNPIWGSDGSNEIYYGSGAAAGKVGIVKSSSTIFQSTSDVVADAWRFLAIVDTGTEIKAYYGNEAGSIVDMGNSVGAYTSLNGMTLTRTNQGVNANNYRGYIDEAWIFNRALSLSEISTIYNGGTGLRGNTDNAPFNSGASLGYHFDEAAGDFATDASGNEKLGTLNNGAAWFTGKVPI